MLVLEIVVDLSRECVEGIRKTGVAGCGDKSSEGGRLGSFHCPARHLKVLYRMSSGDDLVKSGIELLKQRKKVRSYERAKINGEWGLDRPCRESLQIILL